MRKETVFDVTHRLILEEATALFLEKGYKNTSTRDIANAVNITQPALYYHFSNKEILFIQVNLYIGEQLQSEIEAIQKENSSLEKKLEKCTKAFLAIYQRDIFSFIHQSSTEMEIESKKALFNILEEYYIGPIQQIFESSDQLLNSKINSKKAANFYLMSLSLLFANVHQLSSEKEKSEQIEELIYIILHGILL